jgi:hypothetical protein
MTVPVATMNMIVVALTATIVAVAAAAMTVTAEAITAAMTTIMKGVATSFLIFLEPVFSRDIFPAPLCCFLMFISV